MKRTDTAISDILFDLGQVLVPFDRDIGLQRLRPHLPPQQARLLDEDKLAFLDQFSEPADSLEKGEIEFDLFRRVVENILGVRIAGEDFRTIWCDIFSLDHGMVSLGESLAPRYGTWLVSNTSRAHYEWIVGKFPRIAFYKDSALSFELGVMKPSDEYYTKAVDRFGIDPTRSIFIDDLPENVDGAVRAGMHGIVFTGLDTLVDRLREFGVEIPGEKGLGKDNR